MAAGCRRGCIGLPRTISVNSDEMVEALSEPVETIMETVHMVLERTPPELSADIMRGGIHLTGDGSRLFALDRYISENLGIPVLLAKDPGDCCILGIGYLTENIQLISPQNSRHTPKPAF